MTTLTTSAPAGSRGSLHEALRRATRDAHEALDARLTPAGPWTLTDYERLLRASLAVVGALEPSINSHLAGFTEPGRSRTASIEQDLRAIGAQVPLPPAASTLVHNKATALGAAYVLQGSMLGGAVIRRALARDLGAGSHIASYLDYHGQKLGSVWQGFLADLDAFNQHSNAEARQDVIDAARATFDAFSAALNEQS